MTEKEIQSKWMFIAAWLIELKAPIKVVNAAIEIDNALIALGLGHNTPKWDKDYDSVSQWDRSTYPLLHNLIMSDSYCSACYEVDYDCGLCKLGDHHHCTPRSRYAANYFSIVRKWTQNQIDKEI